MLAELLDKLSAGIRRNRVGSNPALASAAAATDCPVPGVATPTRARSGNFFKQLAVSYALGSNVGSPGSRCFLMTPLALRGDKACFAPATGNSSDILPRSLMACSHNAQASAITSGANPVCSSKYLRNASGPHSSSSSSRARR